MKKSLLIIDVQNDYFFGGSMELVGIETAAASCGRVLEFFRNKKLPVFHIQHIASSEGATFFLPETEGAKIHASVAPKENESVITKKFPSSFRQTNLHEQLQQQNIEELVICGAMTHMCIDTTVRAAFDLGYSCTVIEDGCATKDLEFGGMKVDAAQVQAAYMAALSSPFAKIISARSFAS